MLKKYACGIGVGTISVVAERSQVTIPKALRDRLGIVPGTCEAVWAEVATAYAPDSDVADDLRALCLRYLHMSEDAALRAAQAWAAYRRAGGARRRIAADFLIGGHAACQADRLLTRDEGFHRKLFTGLQVESPETGA